MANLLNITNAIADEIGFQRPVTIISNNDDDARQLLQLSNREGRNLVKAADWTILQRVHTFSTASGTDEYDLPDDYSRLLRETEWNRSTARPMRGPVNPQEWQTIKSGLLGGGVVNDRFRIFRGTTTTTRKIYIDPTPTSTETIAFEYISSGWLSNAAQDTTYTSWQVDTDILILDEDLLVLGSIVRWKRSKGLDFTSEADEMMLIIDREKGQDRPSPVLNMAHQDYLRLLDDTNLPESGYGS